MYDHAVLREKAFCSFSMSFYETFFQCGTALLTEVQKKGRAIENFCTLLYMGDINFIFIPKIFLFYISKYIFAKSGSALLLLLFVGIIRKKANRKLIMVQVFNPNHSDLGLIFNGFL